MARASYAAEVESSDQQLVYLTLMYGSNTLTESLTSYNLAGRCCELSRSADNGAWASFVTKPPAGACLAIHLFSLAGFDS